MGLSLSVRGFLRSEHFYRSMACLDQMPFLLILDCMCLGSSLPLKSFACPGLLLFLFGMAHLEGGLPVTGPCAYGLSFVSQIFRMARGSSCSSMASPV